MKGNWSEVVQEAVNSENGIFVEMVEKFLNGWFALVLVLGLPVIYYLLHSFSNLG